MAAYTFLAADLRTNAILAELPLTDVDFETLLNGAGSLSASLPLAGLPTGLDAIEATAPVKTALYVDRDGTLVWGGIIWTRSYDSESESLTLGGNEFWSYFRRRFILATQDFGSTDQLLIARQLVNYAQAKVGGNIGVTVGSEVSGVIRDRLYHAYEQKNLGEAVEELAAVERGFDFAIDVAWSGGSPAKTLVLNYPRRGRIASQTGLVVTAPGEVLSWSYPEDGTEAANFLIAQGDLTFDAGLVAQYADATLLDAGYPLLEMVQTYADVRESSTLHEHARADLAARSSVVQIPSVTLRGAAEPVIGSYVTGDEVRVDFDACPRFPDGTSVTKRIIGYKVTPGVGDGAIETVHLTLGEPL